MTALATNSPRTAAPEDTRTSPAGHQLAVVGGVGLVAGAVLFFGGMLTSPAQASDAKADYLASLARNPMITQVSAVLLHYGNLLMGAGFLVLPWLVRGRRGGVLTLIGALASALALLNTSGALVSDWFHLEIGRRLGSQAGAALSDAVLAHPLFSVAFRPGPLTLVASIVLFAGLARAGVVGWWSLIGLVAGTAGLMFLPYDHPVLPALGVLPMLAVFAFAGLRVLQRVRADQG